MFCYKIVHIGTWIWCIAGLVQQVCTNRLYQCPYYDERCRNNISHMYTILRCFALFTGDPLHSRAACTQPCNVNTHSRAQCSPGARLCEQWGHGCVNNGARLCAIARLCKRSPGLLWVFNNSHVNLHDLFIHTSGLLHCYLDSLRSSKVIIKDMGNLFQSPSTAIHRHNTLCAKLYK